MNKKKVLVIVDVQNDFIDGTLGNQEAVKCIPNILEKIKGTKWDKIYATRDTHKADYLTTQEGKKLPVEHCIDGTEGHLIHKDVMDLLLSLQKNGTEVSFINKSIFGSTILCVDISREFSIFGQDVEVEFVGFCTDICVVSNALMLRSWASELNIIVDASCCAGVTIEKHNSALETMKSCQITVINE